MANAEIVVIRKHGNVFIGGKPMKIYLQPPSKETAVLGKAKLGKMKLGAK